MTFQMFLLMTQYNFMPTFQTQAFVMIMARHMHYMPSLYTGAT
uniref:Alternative protein SNX13 n=1 Tax=Homo sapiens TaxID=9606 RepID=L8E8M6_HUMAN|nr:alternative protein SNX13 [Homo sapiens]